MERCGICNIPPPHPPHSSKIGGKDKTWIFYFLSRALHTSPWLGMMILSLGFPAPGDLSSFLKSSSGGPGEALGAGAGAGEVLAATGAGLSLFCWRPAEIKI